jgi:nucleoside-diphosphate-sugar epimerase
VNIGSEEMVTINQLANMAIEISGKTLSVENIYGASFFNKYGFECPTGVRGRNSDNRLFRKKIGWSVSQPLYDGMLETYKWIDENVKAINVRLK